MMSKFIRYFGGGFLVLAVVAAAYGAIFGGPVQPEYIMKVSAEKATKEDIQKAKGYLDGFLQTCPNLLGKFEGRIAEGPKIELQEPEPYREDTYGWPLEVAVKLVVKSDAGVASGHHLRYYMWNDLWITQKDAGAEFCGQVPGLHETLVYTKGEPASNAPIPVEVDEAEKAESKKLASDLGLKYGQRYSYTEWKQETLKGFRFYVPAIGDCGTWTEPKKCERQASYEGVELIYCSHGKDRYGTCTTPGDGPFLEGYYLTKEDVTLLAEEHLTQQGSYFTLLQLAEGRKPELYKH